MINDWRRHREDFFDGASRRAKLDQFSSAITFTGWTERFSNPAGYDPLPVSPPETEPLRAGCRRFGRIDPYERPGPLP